MFQTNDLDFERRGLDDDARSSNPHPKKTYKYSPIPAGLLAYSRIAAVPGRELAPAAPLELPLALEKLTDRRGRLRLLLAELLLLLLLGLLGGRVSSTHRRGPCIRERHDAVAGSEGRQRVVETRGSDAHVRRHGELLGAGQNRTNKRVG